MGVVLKNMKSKLKDLIYQNMLINDTGINANFMVSTKRQKKSSLPLFMFYLVFKKPQKEKYSREKKMKLYCKRNECKKWHFK